MPRRGLTAGWPVYSRKSSEDGLDQEFNSLDAQREAGEAYVANQKVEGWVCLPERYDDGGFCGGSMDRPALKRLLCDIEAGRIDCVVVYKVDRLSRSLMDFARMMETFEKHNVSFVSVTQRAALSRSRLPPRECAARMIDGWRVESIMPELPSLTPVQVATGPDRDGRRVRESRWAEAGVS